MKLAISRRRALARCALAAAACAASAALATRAQAPTIWGPIAAGPIDRVASDEGDIPPAVYRLRLSPADKRTGHEAGSRPQFGAVLFTSAAACEFEPDVAESNLETDLVGLSQDVLSDPDDPGGQPAASGSSFDYQLDHGILAYDADSGTQGYFVDAGPGTSAVPGGFAVDDSGHSPYTDVALNPQLGSSGGMSPPEEPQLIALYDPLLPLGPEDDGEILPDLFLPDSETESANRLNLAAGESGDSPATLAAVPEPASLLTWSLLLGCGLYSARRLRRG